jgi:hypothetical protein
MHAELSVVGRLHPLAIQVCVPVQSEIVSRFFGM